MFDRKEIDPKPKAYIYHGSAGRARNRRVKTGLPNTTPHFFTHYSHASTLFPNLKLLISASALPNPIVATGFYAARQPCQLSQGADLPPPHEEQRVTAAMIRHSVSPACGRRPQAGFGEGLHRTRRFHLAVLNRRSASLWPTTNRWFFGKASTRSNRLCQLTPQK